MTRQEAIEKAAGWWYQMIRCGKWDNGDAHTEVTRSMFRSLAYQPTEDDYVKLRPGLIEMIEQLVDKNETDPTRYGRLTVLYADYGCPALDNLYQRLGLQMTSGFHCPQKAGTTITKDDDGDYYVKAKEGYGADWTKI